MSFRQFGGLQFASKHNAVASYYNTTSNLLVTQNVGQPNSYITFLSDISGNITIYGNLDVSGNIHVSGDIDISGNLYVQENIDISGNLHVGGNIDCSGNGSFNNSIYLYDLSSNVLYNSVIYQDNSAFNIQNNNAGGYIYINPSGATGLTVNNFGQVGIGTGSPQYTLDVSGNVNAISYNSSSDYRIKENVTQLDSMFVVDKLNPVTYLNKKSDKQDIGLIAHELQEIFPELVNGEKDGEQLQSVNYIGLIPVLIKEVQELKKEIILVKIELNELKNK
jgi:hypothetical protein